MINEKTFRLMNATIERNITKGIIFDYLSNEENIEGFVRRNILPLILCMNSEISGDSIIASKFERLICLNPINMNESIINNDSQQIINRYINNINKCNGETDISDLIELLNVEIYVDDEISIDIVTNDFNVLEEYRYEDIFIKSDMYKFIHPSIVTYFINNQDTINKLIAII